MAGHSKFKNIQHRKGAQDQKRAKIFTKLVREIITAARSGSPDPSANARLRNAISCARSHNLPKERIDRAITQASSVVDDNYVEIRYEGFAPGGVAIIVEVLTDNKNRSASDVRSAFAKFGGNLAETGSVSFMFNHVGIIKYHADIVSADELLENAINAGANDVVSYDQWHCVYTLINDFADCYEKLSQIYDKPNEAYIGWKSHDLLVITDQEQCMKILKLIDTLEDNDDVQRVFGNYSFANDVNLKQE